MVVGAVVVLVDVDVDVDELGDGCGGVVGSTVGGGVVAESMAVGSVGSSSGVVGGSGGAGGALVATRGRDHDPGPELPDNLVPMSYDLSPL